MHSIDCEPAPPRSAPRPDRIAGFTMTELLVTVSVAAILATVAVPSFSGLIASQRARTFASELNASLLETRAHALGLDERVTLEAKTGGWPAGWQIVDSNNNVLADHGPAAGVTVSGPGGVTYTPTGHLPIGSAQPVFVVTTTSGSQTDYQCVSVDLSGRPYVRAASTCS